MTTLLHATSAARGQATRGAESRRRLCAKVYAMVCGSEVQRSRADPRRAPAIASRGRESRASRRGSQARRGFVVRATRQPGGSAAVRSYADRGRGWHAGTPDGLFFLALSGDTLLLSQRR
jgi:hypothetical protein